VQKRRPSDQHMKQKRNERHSELVQIGKERVRPEENHTTVVFKKAEKRKQNPKTGERIKRLLVSTTDVERGPFDQSQEETYIGQGRARKRK